MLLSYLRKWRYTLGRSIFTVAAGAWLIVSSQACLSATKLLLPQDVTDKAFSVFSINTAHKQAVVSADPALINTDCPPAFCAVFEASDQDTINQIKTTDWLPDHDVAHQSSWAPPQPKLSKSRPGKVYMADYLPPHPTLRFCILRC